MLHAASIIAKKLVTAPLQRVSAGFAFLCFYPEHVGKKKTQ